MTATAAPSRPVRRRDLAGLLQSAFAAQAFTALGLNSRPRLTLSMRTAAARGTSSAMCNVVR